MREISESLGTIEAGLRRLDREVLLRSLRPGLPPADVLRIFDQTSLDADDQLVQLFGWRDGIPPDSDAPLGTIWLFPGFYFPSLEESLSNYLAFRTSARWAPGWFPLFADGGGDFYFQDCSVTGERSIRRFRLEEIEHPIEYESLSAMLQTIGEAFARGVYFVDSLGNLEVSDEDFAGLARAMNPHVEWWKG